MLTIKNLQTIHLKSHLRQTNEQLPNFLFPYRITTTQTRSITEHRFYSKTKNTIPEHVRSRTQKIKKPPELSRDNRAF